MDFLDREESSQTLRDYLHILRLRLWLIVLLALFLPAAAVFFSLRQQHLYQASSDVLVKRQDLAAALSGIPTPYEDPTRFVQTQVDLAEGPLVAKRTLAAVGIDAPPTYLLNHSNVIGQSNSDLMTFNVTNQSRSLAMRLADEYARQFTLYRRQLDTSAISAAVRVRKRRSARVTSNRSRARPRMPQSGFARCGGRCRAASGHQPRKKGSPVMFGRRTAPSTGGGLGLRSRG